MTTKTKTRCMTAFVVFAPPLYCLPARVTAPSKRASLPSIYRQLPGRALQFVECRIQRVEINNRCSR